MLLQQYRLSGEDGREGEVGGCVRWVLEGLLGGRREEGGGRGGEEWEGGGRGGGEGREVNTQKNARKGKDMLFLLHVVLQVLFTHTQYVYFTEYACSIRVHT